MFLNNQQHRRKRDHTDDHYEEDHEDGHEHHEDEHEEDSLTVKQVGYVSFPILVQSSDDSLG